MGERTWNCVGHCVGPAELDLIKTVVDDYAGLSREELAATVCELLGWTRATGRPKARECRDLLERLEVAGVVRLPARRIGRPVGAGTAVPVTARGDVQPLVTGPSMTCSRSGLIASPPLMRARCSGNSSGAITILGTPCRTAPTCAIWCMQPARNRKWSPVPSFQRGLAHGVSRHLDRVG